MNHLPLLIRREFWEHRSFIIAPAIVAAILLIGMTFGHVEFGNTSLDLLGNPEFASKHYGIMTGVLSFVALPYLISMGCLTSSICSTACMPTARIVVSCSGSRCRSRIARLLSQTDRRRGRTSVDDLRRGAGVESDVRGHWEHSPERQHREHLDVVWLPRAWFSAHALLLYSLVVMILWYLPILGWLVLVSAWARRAVILWAVLPPLALMFLEHVLFDTRYVAHLLRDRFIGWFNLAINTNAAAEHSMVLDGERIPMTARLSDTLDPGHFFSSPGLWLGIVVAAGFIWGAILLRRRYSET